MDTTHDTQMALVIKTLEDSKALDLQSIDIRVHNSIADTLIIASGTSSRHIKSMADILVEKVKASGEQPLGVEGEDGSDWILVDLGNIVVHLMLPEARARYDLEHLWKASPARKSE